MTALAREQAVIVMAQQLGLEWRSDPIHEIIAFCVNRIEAYLRPHPKVTSIRALEEIVCRALGLTFEEVWSDDDLNAIIKKYVEKKDVVFASLTTTFDDGTYAALFARKGVKKSDADEYVAVIDCRGTKAARRFFSRWHEIAHLLTLYTQLEFPFHRSTLDRNPTERLMDQIAGEIGFYDPLFRPQLQSSLAECERLTFETVESLRQSLCPDASFQAVLIACVNKTERPVVYVEGGMALKKDERRQRDSGQTYLFPEAEPQKRFRAHVAVPNTAANLVGLDIHQNIAIPATSVLSRLYTGASRGQEKELTGQENLSTWLHSDGSHLGDKDVHVEARYFEDKVIAIIQPARSSYDGV